MKMVRNTALWLLLLSTVASAQTNSSVILKLVDASESERNAREIVTFLNDAVVDIVKANTTAFSVAAVAGDEVISVKFDNDETEANRPFARCGDVYGRFLPCEDLVMGTHTVSVTTYPEAEQGGTPLETVSATFEITDSSIPTQSPTPALTLDITEVVFQLEDASTGEANGTPLVNLTDGAIVDLDELRTSTLGIVALCGGDVGSVVFENGQKESNRPFSRCGGGEYPWTFSRGRLLFTHPLSHHAAIDCLLTPQKRLSTRRRALILFLEPTLFPSRPLQKRTNKVSSSQQFR